MENQQVLSAKELVERYGQQARFMIMDIKEAIELIRKLERKVELNIEQLQQSGRNNKQENVSAADDVAIMQRDYGMKLPVKVEQYVSTGGDGQRNTGGAVIQEWEIPSCSDGDDNVFYMGDGSEEQPIEID